MIVRVAYPPDEMSDRTRRGLLRSLGLAGAVGLAGCTNDDRDDEQAEESEPPERSERWVTATRAAATTLLPHRAVDDASASRLELLLDGAYAVTPGRDREIVPFWLDVETLDASTYAVTLREGLRWSDPYGRMTADDWIYYVRRVHQGRDNWAGSRLAGAWAGAELERTGERSFEVRLPDPNAEFPYEPALRESWCLPRELLEPYAEKRDREGLETDADLAGLAYTGNLGPYIAEQWERGERFVAARNDAYYMRNAENVSRIWSEAPYFDEYEYRVLGDERDRLQALRTGTATTTPVPPARLEQFRGNARVALYVVPRPTITVLAYNQRANGWAPFRNREVRRACSMAIDKRALAEAVYEGYAEPVHTFQPPWSVWDGTELTAFGRRPDEDEGENATTLLEEALDAQEYGYDEGRLLDAEGEPVTWTLVYVGESGRTTALASFVRRELERLGVAIEPERVGYEELLAEYMTTEWRGEGDPPWQAGEYNAGPRDGAESSTAWDLLCGPALNAYPLAPTTTDRFWLERGDMNFSGYVPDVELTALYAEARAATDERERGERLDRVFRALNREQPANFLAARREPVGYRRRIAGPRESPNYDWDRQTWYAE